MRTREITFASRGIRLRGTLLTPNGEGPTPTALLLAGSGPLDRNGNHKRLPLGISRDLAALLADQGWASFRFDKRGVGESEGDYLSTGFYDELADAEAALMFLQSLSEVGPLVVVGHSVGAIYAGELADRHPEIAGAVLLSTSAKNGEETLTWQAAQMQDVIVPAPVRVLMRLFGTGVLKQQAKAIAKLERTTTDVARIQLVKVNAKWMREFMVHQPLRSLATAKPPILAITGTKDVQVDVADLEAIAGVNAAVETRAVEDVDHILRHEPAAVSNPRNYKRQIEKDIDDSVAGHLASWLSKIVRGRPPSIGECPEPSTDRSGHELHSA